MNRPSIYKEWPLIVNYFQFISFVKLKSIKKLRLILQTCPKNFLDKTSHSLRVHKYTHRPFYKWRIWCLHSTFYF